MYVIYFKEFQRQGNNDTVDRQKFQVPVSARYIRFHPIQQHDWNCLRVEAYIIESKFSSLVYFLQIRGTITAILMHFTLNQFSPCVSVNKAANSQPR